jgi:hypothetical protein
VNYTEFHAGALSVAGKSLVPSGLNAFQLPMLGSQERMSLCGTCPPSKLSGVAGTFETLVQTANSLIRQ